MNHSILVVEDEPTLLETLEYNLQRQGYTVLTASDGLDALKIAREEKPEMLVLDVMLPGIDGIEVCRTLRQEMNAPILMLTARAEEIDKLIGLEVGADDYMTKPFGMRELLARVKAQLRRVRLIREELTAKQPNASDSGQSTSERMLFGDLVIDLGRREVLFKSEVLHVKPKAFELLVFFANHRGIALSRELILDRVWG